MYINKAGLRIAGAKKEQVFGITLHESGIYDPQQCKYIEEKIRLVFETGESYQEELEYHSAEGLVWLDWCLTPEFDDSENIISVIGIARDITRLKHSEKTLNETEEIFVHFLRNSPIYVFFKDTEIRSLKLSLNYEQMLGRPLEELIGKTMNDLFPSDLAKKMIDDDLKILNSGKTEVFEEEFNGKYYTTIKFPISIDGKPKYLSGYTIEITEQKKTEDALKKSETRYRELIELAPDGILLGNKEGIITEANSKIVKIAGRPINELVGSDIQTLFLEEELTLIPLQYELLKQGETVTTERNIIKPGGSLVPVEMHTKMMPDGTYQSIIHDITARKQVLESFEKRNTFIMAILDNLPIGLAVNEMDSGEATYKNIKFSDIYGWPEEELSNITRFFELIYPDPEYRKKISTRIMKDIESGDINRMHWENIKIQTKDYGERVVSASNIPIIEQNIMVSIVQDSTKQFLADKAIKEKTVELQKELEERRRVENEVNKLNTELEKRVIERTSQLKAANNELESFAYSVSHDLRAPLRAIDGFSKFVLENYKTKLDEEGERLISLIRSNTQKMDQLIINILALSRVTRSDHNVHKVDMTKMALSMYNEVASSDLQRKLKLIVDELPEAYADPIYIKQVWINLISNAIKFSSLKKKPEIKIRGYTENGFHVYSIEDNGAGFNQEYAHKLFGVFQRLHKTDEFEGTGVGLAIVQRIVHRHGGHVWAEGHENSGAIFYFSIPLKNETIK